MKDKLIKLGRAIGKVRAGVIMAFCLLAGVALPPPAEAQTTAMTLLSCTNLPSIINAQTQSNQTSYIPLFQNRGLSLQVKLNASAGVSNVIYYLYPIVDGTNTPTVGVWTWTIACNSTTDVIAVTNWPPSTLAGFVALNLAGITNSHATAVVTNKGVIYGRPN